MNISTSYHSHANQRGSVMLVAMIFLLLTSVIALTTMNTSILEIKMAGNQQYQEEAIQVAEGAIDQVIYLHNDPVNPTLPLNSANLGERFCKTTSTNTECVYKTMYITPELMADIARVLPDGTDPDTIIDFWAYRKSSTSASRSGEDSAGSVLHSYFEIFSDFQGSKVGLSDSFLAIGVDKKTLDLSSTSGGQSVSVGAGKDGTGGGIYRML